MMLEHKLHRAAQALSAEYDLEPAMTARQVVFLDQLAAGGSMNLTKIANATGIDRTTTATMARTLAKHGLVTLHLSRSDTRAKSIALTDAGREALKSARSKITAADRKAMARLSAQERQALIAALNVIADLLSTPKAGLE
jgi:DNA-binding MarR family transcriptional regulator